MATVLRTLTHENENSLDSTCPRSASRPDSRAVQNMIWNWSLYVSSLGYAYWVDQSIIGTIFKIKTWLRPHGYTFIWARILRRSIINRHPFHDQKSQNKNVRVRVRTSIRDDRHQHPKETKFAHTFPLNSLSPIWRVLESFAGHPPSHVGMARDFSLTGNSGEILTAFKIFTPNDKLYHDAHLHPRHIPELRIQVPLMSQQNLTRHNFTWHEKKKFSFKQNAL